MAQQVGQTSPDGYWVWNGAQWVPNSSAVARVDGPAWARPYESARSRARWVTFFLAGAAVATLPITTAAVITDSNAFGSLNDSQALALSLFFLVAVVAYLGTYIPAVVFFSMWVHRLVRNMPALGSPDPRWTPAGAVGRCFIPFLSLAHPLLSTLDAWRGADPRHRHMVLDSRKVAGTPRLIVGWWALWLSAAYAGNAARYSSAVLDILSGILIIGAAVLAVLVVREVTTRQDRKNELIATGQLG